MLVYCGQTVGWIKMKLRWELSSPSPKRGQNPQFSAHVYCGQTTAWIKMPLGMEVGLDPRHIVLDGDQAHPPPQKKGAHPQIFGLCVLWPNGWMDQHAAWYECKPRSRPHCVTWDPAPSPQKGHSPPIFGPCLLRPNGRPSQPLLSTCSCLSLIIC